MRRIEEVKLNKYEIARLFNEFFSFDCTITIGEFSINRSENSFSLLSQLFSEFVLDATPNTGEHTTTPVWELEHISDLFKEARSSGGHMAYVYGCEDDLRARCKRFRKYLDIGRKHYQEIVGNGELDTIESYIDGLLASIQREDAELEIKKSIEEHYRARRAESLEVISSPKLRTLIMERDGAKCKWCEETEGLALDHVLPVSAGGTDDPDNLQLLCVSCNSSKRDRVPTKAREEAIDAFEEFSKGTS